MLSNLKKFDHHINYDSSLFFSQFKVSLNSIESLNSPPLKIASFIILWLHKSSRLSNKCHDIKTTRCIYIASKMCRTPNKNVHLKVCVPFVGEMCHSCHQLISLHVIFCGAHIFPLSFCFLGAFLWAHCVSFIFVFSLFPFKCVLSLHLHCLMEQFVARDNDRRIYSLTMSYGNDGWNCVRFLKIKRNEHLW